MPGRPAWRPGTVVNADRVSASKESHANPTTTASIDPSTMRGDADAERPPGVRERHGLATAQRRQAWMSVSRMPRAPMSNSSSISRWAPARGTIARTATQPSRWSGEIGRALDARREGDGGFDAGPLDVVVHHHVAPGHQDALEPALEDLQPGRRVAAAGDQHGLGLQDRLAEDLQPGLTQRAAGLDDVGDRVGDAEPHARLDRAVEADHRRVDAAVLEEGTDHADVRRGDAACRPAARGR